MAELTPKERVLRLLRKEPIDTMPFFSGMGMVVMPGIEKSGYNFPTVHTDAERMAWSAIWSARLMNFDCVVIPYDMTMESEAMGNTISLYADSEDILYPTIPNKIWSTLDEVEIPDKIWEKGRLPILADAIKIIKENAPELAIGCWQLGPFTQAGQVLELDLMLKGIFKQKEKVENILDKISDMIIDIGKWLQASGCDYITLREPGVAADLLSPKTFKNFIQPRLTRILAGWESPKLLHICGKTEPLLAMMSECGADGLTVDIKCDVKKGREILGPDVLFMGNIDTYTMTCDEKTPKDKAIEHIKGMIDGGIDAVMPGCDLWPAIIEENMKACVDTTHEYGKNPSPAVGRL
ncbi:MAG: uroporphyrinogen decarboxylase family protein [Thermodesulfobacteriota bacterium]|nr:uroporphyrinogen decarboxylase family protein [Thermodesulfobacteriota bacterium]